MYCIVGEYSDHSGITGVFGPWKDKAIADEIAERLKSVETGATQFKVRSMSGAGWLSGVSQVTEAPDPDMCVNARCNKHYGGPEDWNCQATRSIDPDPQCRIFQSRNRCTRPLGHDGMHAFHIPFEQRPE